MANITIENGIYTNLENASPHGISAIGKKRIGDPANLVTDLETGDIATKLVNAVEIDWNVADFANAPAQNPGTISTSGDLIKAIKWASTVESGSGGGHGQMGVTGAQGIHGISS